MIHRAGMLDHSSNSSIRSGSKTSMSFALAHLRSQSHPFEVIDSLSRTGAISSRNPLPQPPTKSFRVKEMGKAQRVFLVNGNSITWIRHPINVVPRECEQFAH